MNLDQQVKALSDALHRKLCNYGNDIRHMRRTKPRDRQGMLYTLPQMLAKRSQVDALYSACKRNEGQQDAVLKQSRHLEISQSYREL